MKAALSRLLPTADSQSSSCDPSTANATTLGSATRSPTRVVYSLGSRITLALGLMGVNLAVSLPGCGIPCEVVRKCEGSGTGGVENAAGAGADGEAGDGNASGGAVQNAPPADGGLGGEAASTPNDPVVRWKLHIAIAKSGSNVGTGIVQVQIGPQLLECGAQCSAATDHVNGELITLTVQPRQSSGYWFKGWSGDCSGQEVCKLTMDRAHSVKAVFEAVNFAFVTSATYGSDEGGGYGIRTYEAHCNELATAAGINTEAENAYTAAMWDSVSSLEERLSGARGWIRTDGEPFLDKFSRSDVMNVLNRDENGNRVDDSLAWSGTPTENCENWTGSGASGGFGKVGFGPERWLTEVFPPTDCQQLTSAHVYCLMRTLSVDMNVSAPGGSKLAFLAPPFQPGPGADPDAHCEAAKPAGTGVVKALLARAGLAASAVLHPATTYRRPDGVAVGTGSQLAAGTPLSGIWQAADGTYIHGTGDRATAGSSDDRVFLGASSPGVTGSSKGTCGDWQLREGSSPGGTPGSVSSWWAGATPTCGLGGIGGRIYCVEQ